MTSEEGEQVPMTCVFVVSLIHGLLIKKDHIKVGGPPVCLLKMHTGIHSEGLKPTPKSVFLLESGHIFSTLHLGVHFFFIHCVCAHGCSHGGQRAPGLDSGSQACFANICT